MNKLSEHINEEVEKFDAVLIREHLSISHFSGGLKVDVDVAGIRKKIEQSLKSIAYKSIDAVRVEGKEPVKWSKEDREMVRMIEGQKDEFQLPCTESVQTNGIDNYNLAIQKSAQKEKEYKDE